MNRMSSHEPPIDVVEADNGPRMREPERHCIVSRKVLPREQLVRFVLSPDGVVVPDLKARLPGRGAWVDATMAMVNEAVRRNLFARAFKRSVEVPDGLSDQVAEQLKTSALGALGLAQRAGLVLSGFTKVEAALRGSDAGFLLQAADGAPDGLRKLAGLARTTPICRIFTSEELSLALGRGNVIHAAVRSGPQLQALLGRCRRYARYLGQNCAVETK